MPILSTPLQWSNASAIGQTECSVSQPPASSMLAHTPTQLLPCASTSLVWPRLRLWVLAVTLFSFSIFANCSFKDGDMGEVIVGGISDSVNDNDSNLCHHGHGFSTYCLSDSNVSLNLSLSPQPTLSPESSSSLTSTSRSSAPFYFFHFRYQKQPIVLRIPLGTGSRSRYPLQGLPKLQLTAELLEGLSLSPQLNRVVGFVLPYYGPTVPVVCFPKLQPNQADSPYEVLIESSSSAPIPPPLLTSSSPSTPASVVDVEYAELLQWTRNDSTNTSLPSRLVSALQRLGYFRIRIPGNSTFARLLSTTTDTALQMFALPAQEKSRYRREFEYSKFFGYSIEGARQFQQVRTCKELPPWPPGTKVPFSSTFLFLAAIARVIMRTLSAAKELQLDFASQVEPMLEPLPGSLDPLTFLEQMDIHLAGRESSAPPELFQSVVWPEERAQRFHTQLTSVPADDGLDRSEDQNANRPSSENDAVNSTDPSLICKPAAFLDRYSLGPDVLRFYQYFRASDQEPPKLSRAATGLHVDMGLLTVSPRSSIPGLVVLHPDGSRWTAVEEEEDDGSLYLNVLSGETMSFLTRGVVRAAAHFVDEIPGAPRVSMPFFLRANPHSICNGRTIRSFLEEVAFPRRAIIALDEAAPSSLLNKSPAIARPVRKRKNACKWSDY